MRPLFSISTVVLLLVLGGCANSHQFGVFGFDMDAAIGTGDTDASATDGDVNDAAMPDAGRSMDGGRVTDGGLHHDGGLDAAMDAGDAGVGVDGEVSDGAATDASHLDGAAMDGHVADASLDASHFDSGVDAGHFMDGSVGDASHDAAVDAGHVMDATVSDSGHADGATLDSGHADAGTTDAGHTMDSGTTDAGHVTDSGLADSGHIADAGIDASHIDAAVDAGHDAGHPDLGVTDLGIDAAHDLGVVDAHVDLGMDAAMDAGMDAGMDASMDAGHPMDAGADAAMDLGMLLDAGADSGDAEIFPAFQQDLPQLLDNGGPKLVTPKIVTVTWPSDPNAAAYNLFDDTLGTTPWWNAVAPQYGLNPAVGGGHVSESTPLTSGLTDTALDNFVANKVAGAPGNGWPVWDPNTLYLIYLPPTVSLNLGGQDACAQGAGGYHTETSNSVSQHVIYGVVIQACPDPSGLSTLDNATLSASHEIIEAATDPETNSSTSYGWLGAGTDYAAWEFFTQGNDEAGDWCEWYNDSSFKDPTVTLNHEVQRIWSNASAAAGHNPCVPVPAGPYYITTPLNLTTVNFTYQGQPVTSQGIVIHPGGSGVVRLGFASDAPAPAWQVQLMQGGIFPAQSGTATTGISFAPTMANGQNGDTIDVTVNVSSSLSGPQLITAVSNGSDGNTRYMPILIVVQ